MPDPITQPTEEHQTGDQREQIGHRDQGRLTCGGVEVTRDSGQRDADDVVVQGRDEACQGEADDNPSLPTRDVSRGSCARASTAAPSGPRGRSHRRL